MDIAKLPITNRGVTWFKERAHGAYAKAWLFFFSFTESSFLFIPPDVLLIAILLAGARQWVYYATLTTVASVLGAIFGYAIAVFFFDTVGVHIISFYNLSGEVETIRMLFNSNVFLATFIGAFTPVPYKVFVLGAGFLKVNFFMFLLASILGRGLRYFIISYAVKRFGDRAVVLLSRYSTALTVGVGVLFIAFLVQKLLF